MTIKVHIIDSSKASLVMSSEVFKDKIPGSIVSFSLTAKEGLANLQARSEKDSPDAIVVDFNLPDADGVTLIKELRKFYNGPIFMTAHPDKIVDFAVNEELFHYHDACCWIPKPVRYENLEKRIEQFVINRHRLLKRFDVSYPSLMVGKGEGRGKRAPKYDGHLINISLGGVCMAINEGAKLRRDEEFVLTMGVPHGLIQGATAISVLKPMLTAAKASRNAAAKKAEKSSNSVGKRGVEVRANAKTKMAAKGNKAAAIVEKSRQGAVNAGEPSSDNQISYANLDIKNLQEYKLKATVAWTADGGRKVGLKFAKIPESQRRHLEVFLKGLSA